MSVCIRVCACGRGRGQTDSRAQGDEAGGRRKRDQTGEHLSRECRAWLNGHELEIKIRGSKEPGQGVGVDLGPAGASDGPCGAVREDPAPLEAPCGGISIHVRHLQNNGITRKQEDNKVSSREVVTKPCHHEMSACVRYIYIEREREREYVLQREREGRKRKWK